MNESILKIVKLRKAFGGVIAVNDLDLSITRGTIASIIGPNGAGKTTMFDLITGYVTPTSGSIIYGDKSIIGKKTHVIAGLGIARTFQNVRIFSDMTVLENVMVGRHLRSQAGLFFSSLIPPFFRKEENAIRDAAKKWLAFVGLEKKSDEAAGTLPLGSQRILEVARSLAMEPQLLLLDEPASGLNTRETMAMGELIVKIKEMGTTVVLVEHDMELVMNISDVVTVINFGSRIAHGTPVDVQENPDVVMAYLGE